jgi:hypothetical protein
VIRQAAQTTEELEMQAVELARQHAEDEVAAFEREGEVAQAAMVRVLEDAAAVATDVAVGKMHAAAAREAVEAVAMEAAMASLCAMRNDAAMVSLEAVAKEAAKVTVRELRDSIVTCEAVAEAQMYADGAAAEESHVAAAAVVVAGNSVWLLVDSDETEVEDEDDDDEAAAAAEAACDAELRAGEVRVKAVAEAERVAEAKPAECEAAAERATHWATEMDKALAYRRDVDRRDVHRRLAVRRAETEHQLERRTLRRQEAAIRSAMPAIKAAAIAGNNDGGAPAVGRRRRWLRNGSGYVTAVLAT